MKLLTTTAVLATFTAVLASASFAADSTSSRPAKGGKPGGGKPDSTALTARLSEDYAKISPYDLNLNGQLEESEQEQLADAITAGTVTFAPPPGRTPPEGAATPPAEHMVRHIAGMYAAVAPYDANVDGTLSADEQAALKTAIESGKLPGPGGPGHGRKGPGPKGGKGGSAETES